MLWEGRKEGRNKQTQPGVTTPGFTVFDGASLQSSTVRSIFLSPSLSADYERRGSASQDHEESRAILAQKIEKETVGNENSRQREKGKTGRKQGAPP